VAETPETGIVKQEPQGPAPDPITSRTMSTAMLLGALLLTGVLIWSLWDEVFAMRPWKGYQQSFAKRYDRYLQRLERDGFKSEREVRESAEYKRLEAAATQARERVNDRVTALGRRVKTIDTQLAAITDTFQDKRGRITVKNYEIEVAEEGDREDLRREVEQMKAETVTVSMPGEDGRPGATERWNFTQLEKKYNDLKDEKGRLLAESGELLRESSELGRQRDDYLKNNVTEMTADQVRLLREKVDNFDVGLKQISINSGEIVDRCETCHVGIREPIKITAVDMMPRGRGRRPDQWARAFVSHPGKELLQIHDPETFGCASCHWGNGRATTSIEKGHGRHRFWLHPLFAKENTEAGCNQCHAGDRVLQYAPTLTRGKDLFQERGCVGCHRYEGFDRESDALTNARQQMKQLEDELTFNEREVKVARAESATARSDEEAQRLLARAESLTVTNSQIEARVDQLNTQSRYLMQDQKKVGPNLKDVRLKLRKEWIPVWLQDPQNFRPGTKMPTYWYLKGEPGTVVPPARQEEERRAISAYLWQSAYEGQMPQQPRGDPAKGKELFETRGCLACHSVGEGEQAVGGEFAANLTRLGQKANYEYIVRWVHNPRERWAPYCPKEKRDLTAEDYAKHNLPFAFDTVKHSRCPNDGAELQVQNMTVMPNFRLSDQDSRDIATYLVSLQPEARYPDAAFMDDPALAPQGRELIKQYGCAGCHEIRGFEEEQRIGKELTAEGATPLERLDFALLTHKAELGHDPYDDKKHGAPWYNHKGFFEHKIEDPALYDKGKEKDPREHLRMPEPFMKPEWKTALVTFLLGSVGTEGQNVPVSLFYNPTDQQKAIQDGWWVIKKYNCMGCHNVQVGQRSVLQGLPLYQQGGALGPEQLPPGLMTEGARVDPVWLLKFLSDPSLSNYTEGFDFGGKGGGAEIGNPGSQPANAPPRPANPAPPPPNADAPNPADAAAAAHAQLKPQPGRNDNGVRMYLRARMPTFNFSPNELRILQRFFLAVSAQQEPYIREKDAPLDPGEMALARALFTSQAAPCLKCHMTGDPGHDRTATAPNFLVAGERLKADWTFRWLLDPQRIMPGTAMPSELFKRDGDRWVFNGPLPEAAADYRGDHARLLVRYLLQLTPDEQARTARAQPAPSGAPPAAAEPAIPVASRGRSGRPPNTARHRAPQKRRGAESAGRAGPRRARQVSRARERARWRQSVSSVPSPRGNFSP
jgi:cbb3-type cytochrome oxidase cytochrome c subunit